MHWRLVLERDTFLFLVHLEAVEERGIDFSLTIQLLDHSSAIANRVPGPELDPSDAELATSPLLSAKMSVSIERLLAMRPPEYKHIFPKSCIADDDEDEDDDQAFQFSSAMAAEFDEAGEKETGSLIPFGYFVSFF